MKECWPFLSDSWIISETLARLNGRAFLLEEGVHKVRVGPMHYRNGREAKNGDKVIQLETSSGKIVATGQLQNAVAGNDYCNGELVITGYGPQGPAIIIGACLCDCVHVDDLTVILAERGLDKRPSGK